MTTLKLESGDLAIENGSLVLLSDLVAETTQRLKIKFQFVLGEWELDQRVGMPLFEKVLVKAPSLSTLRRLYRTIIADDPAVDQVNLLEFDLDRGSRALSINFEATLNDGSSLVFEDFILTESLRGVA